MSELLRGHSSVLLKCIVLQPTARSSILGLSTGLVPATQYPINNASSTPGTREFRLGRLLSKPANRQSSLSLYFLSFPSMHHIHTILYSNYSSTPQRSSPPSHAPFSHHNMISSQPTTSEISNQVRQTLVGPHNWQWQNQANKI